jgi:hypothetical protein
MKRLQLKDLRLNNERGSVIVTAGVMAMAFVLLGAVVVEVGQWFEHRRHIQTRADAAALAAGQALAQCFNIGINGVTEPTVDSQVESWAKSYGGISGGAAAGTGAPYNQQFGTSSSNLMSFQSDTYPSSGNQNPARNLGNECFQADGVTPNLMLDVKMTQEGIPPIFGFSPSESVHGWARVQLQEIQSLRPTMPLAIPDVRPKQVAVTFVNNSTGAALTNCPNGCVFQLAGPTTSGQLNDWAATVPIPAAAMASAPSNIGMRVGIGSQVGTCANVNQTATYTCYDYGSNGSAQSDGVIDLRAYNPTAAGSQSSPVLKAVTPTTCSGTPYFSIYQATGTGTCDAGVTATVDFGASGPPAGAAVQATINGTTVPLANTSGTNTWVSNPVTLPLQGGPYPVRMAWCVSNCSKQSSFTNFNGGNPVQQIFSGSDGSSPILPGGPIFAASVLDNSNNSAFYSFPTNQAASLAVTIGLTGGAHLPIRCSNNTSGATYSCATDPPVLLRFTSGSGNDSLTYAINCGTIPGNGNGPDLSQQIQFGCANPFSLNSLDVCPDPANPSPPDCAPVNTGAKVGQVPSALNARFDPTGMKCDANNYPNYPPDDPRAVNLIITDFSAFTGSGGSTSSNVPVVTFATFYVTGWDSADSSCASVNEPAPPQDAGNGKGSNIWGHYIADVSLGSVPNGRACLPGVTPCAIALTR